MRILGIETSCDETAAALVEDGTKIRSNIVASSSDLHAKTGGIIPEMAARQQIKSMIPVLEEALGKNAKNAKIDAIAVTYGPGLIGSLLVGVETAKTLSHLWSVPIIPVNHLAAHLYANWLEKENGPELPAVGLVVSGGHTDLVLMREHGKIESLGATRDDAAGEAFDKTARLLGLPYPGGPSISKHADKFFAKHKNPNLSLFPRPMSGDESFDFSFSGLKTAVLNETKKNPSPDIARFSAEVQEAIVDVLVEKSIKATKKYEPKSFLLAGGVAANKRLKEKMESTFKDESLETKLYIPKPEYCTDNATYIASFAHFNYSPVNWEKISPDPQLSITQAGA